MRLPLSHERCLRWIRRFYPHKGEMDVRFLMWVLVDGWRSSAKVTLRQLDWLKARVMEQWPLIEEKEPKLKPFPVNKTNFSGADLATVFEHIDYLGFRAAKSHGTSALMEAEPLVALRNLLNTLHELLAHIVMAKFSLICSETAVDLESVLQDMVSVLQEGHASLQETEALAAWPAVSYGKNLSKKTKPVQKGGVSRAFPVRWTDEVQEALIQQQSARTLEQCIRWVQLYAQVCRETTPGWRWLNSIAGRECAFPLFAVRFPEEEAFREASLLDGALEESGWSLTTLRHLGHLCTILYENSKDRPLIERCDPAAILEEDAGAVERRCQIWNLHDTCLAAAIALEKAGVKSKLGKTQQRQLERAYHCVMEFLAMAQQLILTYATLTKTEQLTVLGLFVHSYQTIARELQPWIARLPDSLEPLLPAPSGKTAPRALTGLFSNV